MSQEFLASEALIGKNLSQFDPDRSHRKKMRTRVQNIDDRTRDILEGTKRYPRDRPAHLEDQLEDAKEYIVKTSVRRARERTPPARNKRPRPADSDEAEDEEGSGQEWNKEESLVTSPYFRHVDEKRKSNKTTDASEQRSTRRSTRRTRARLATYDDDIDEDAIDGPAEELNDSGPATSSADRTTLAASETLPEIMVAIHEGDIENALPTKEEARHETTESKSTTSPTEAVVKVEAVQTEAGFTRQRLGTESRRYSSEVRSARSVKSEQDQQLPVQGRKAPPEVIVLTDDDDEETSAPPLKTGAEIQDDQSLAKKTRSSTVYNSLDTTHADETTQIIDVSTAMQTLLKNLTKQSIAVVQSRLEAMLSKDVGALTTEMQESVSKALASAMGQEERMELEMLFGELVKEEITKSLMRSH